MESKFATPILFAALFMPVVAYAAKLPPLAAMKLVVSA
jgi:hypothetical protein